MPKPTDDGTIVRVWGRLQEVPGGYAVSFEDNQAQNPTVVGFRLYKQGVPLGTKIQVVAYTVEE